MTEAHASVFVIDDDAAIRESICRNIPKYNRNPLLYRVICN
jgi:hypothetical protein